MARRRRTCWTSAKSTSCRPPEPAVIVPPLLRRLAPAAAMLSCLAGPAAGGRGVRRRHPGLDAAALPTPLVVTVAEPARHCEGQAGRGELRRRAARRRRDGAAARRQRAASDIPDHPRRGGCPAARVFRFFLDRGARRPHRSPPTITVTVGLTRSGQVTLIWVASLDAQMKTAIRCCSPRTRPGHRRGAGQAAQSRKRSDKRISDKRVAGLDITPNPRYHSGSVRNDSVIPTPTISVISDWLSPTASPRSHRRSSGPSPPRRSSPATSRRPRTVRRNTPARSAAAQPPA